jgi:hypothetical protein
MEVGPLRFILVDGRNILFVNGIKYPDVNFSKRITWRLHKEIIEAKAFRKLIKIYSLFKSERVSANIKVTFHKALIRSVISYACPACELAPDTCLVKLQHVQNKVLRTI